MNINDLIKSSADLVTNREQTRAGFIHFALEKNRYSTPIIESAKSFKVLASKAKTAKDLLVIQEIKPALLTAAGLSDKSLVYFTEQDKNEAISNLIEKFLEPAGKYFIDEAVYRYLIIKGDSLGGSMRNIAGAIAQQKLIRTFLSNLSVMGIHYAWLDNDSKEWRTETSENLFIESSLKAIAWQYENHKRVLAFNLNIPTVKNNIDLCLFDADIDNYNNGEIVNKPATIVMLGELKGGIDPAGADEHWKTGNTALNRIRSSFSQIGIEMKTSFIAAAIEKKMADEIYNQLQNGILSYAVNLTVEEQLINYCDWIIKL